MIYVSMRTHDRKSIQRRKIIPWMALSLQTDNDLLQDILDSNNGLWITLRVAVRRKIGCDFQAVLRR